MPKRNLRVAAWLGTTAVGVCAFCDCQFKVRVESMILHSGYFLRRQYNAFLECQRGGNAERLIEQGVYQGHLRVYQSANRTQTYHVGAKPFFTAIGKKTTAIAVGVSSSR